jgi:8-oxo-dGTP diphosphatase
VAVVVAAALVRAGTVLAAQRSHPPALAGRWELPGGKVEDGETDVEALVRECHEELGVEVAVGGRVGAEVSTASGHRMRVYACSLVAGEPAALDHRALRWLSAGELDDVEWLDADRPLLPVLAQLIHASTNN